MVTLNLTLLVQVGLFLAFMWAMNRFVFRPLLRVMDAREAQIDDNNATAQQQAERADQLEKGYAAKVAAIHREASQTVLEAHRRAQQEHNERVEGLKKQEEQELAAVRAAAAPQIAAQRTHYPQLAGELAALAAQRLRLGGRSS